MTPKNAEEWRLYRAKNKNRINELRRKKRLEKRECENLKLMKPLELVSVVQLSTEEQQTINTFADINIQTIAQLKHEDQAQKAQSHDYGMAVGMPAFAQNQRPLWVVPNSENAQLLSKSKNDTIKKPGKIKHFCEDRGTMPRLLLTLVLGVFLAANTYFLVSEQANFLENFGYSSIMALLIAILTESALVLFSSLAGTTKSWVWKALLYSGMAGTGFVIFSLLNVAVADRASEKMANSERAEMLKKEILTQERLESTALAVIENLNPNTHPTKIGRLKAQLNGSNFEGHTRKLSELRRELAQISKSGGASREIEVLQWQRWAAMIWNMILAGYLGFLWSGSKKQGVFSKSSE